MKPGLKAGTVWCLMLALYVSVAAASALWISDGSPICDAANNQELPEMVSDGAGGAFVAWTDVRSLDFNVYAQRVNHQGAPYWAEDGISVCSESRVQTFPQVASDGAGGVIVAWQDSRDGDRAIYAHRIDANGNFLSGASGVVIVDTTDDCNDHRMAPDGSGGAIVVWEDRRGPQSQIFAQKVTAAGDTVWSRNGKPVSFEADWEVGARVMPDGAGGAFVIWNDARAGNDLYGQHLNADGDTTWTVGGIAICDAENEPRSPVMASDGAGGAFIVWSDQRGVGQVYLYAQRIDADGDEMWAHNGVMVSPEVNGQQYPAIMSDGAGGAWVAWLQGTTNSDVFAQRIDGDGNALWGTGDVEVCGADRAQADVRIIPDGAGGAILSWEDYRGSDTDLYAQRLSGSGNIQWAVDGMPVCAAIRDQEYHRMVPDGAGGAVYVWEDSRNNEWDIYGSRIDANGQQVPAELAAFEAGHLDGAVIVTWTLSTDDAEPVYTIYRRKESGGEPWMKLDARVDGVNGSYSFTDEAVVPGTEYRYRVDVRDETGSRTLFETAPVAVPSAAMTLFQNAPNPFNPSTAIRYYLPLESAVTLTVYDAAGRRVAVITDGQVQQAGYHTAEWAARGSSGEFLSSGVYFYRLQAGKLTATRKMILLK